MEGVFVALEVGLAVVLLAGAGLMIQSIWRLWRVDPGFETRHLLTSQVGVSPTVMGNGPGIRIAYQQMLDHVASVPGADAAAVTNLIPLSDSDNEIGVWLSRGPQPPPDKMTSVLFFLTTPNYLRVMGIPMLEGRFFTGTPPPRLPSS